MASSVAIMPSNGDVQLRLAQLPVLLFERVDVEGAADDQPQHVGVDRLLIEIVGAERHGAHRVVAVVVAGDDDDLGLRREAAASRCSVCMPSLDAFGIGRQAEVLQHHRRLEAAQLRQRFAARAPRSALRARRSTT